jgi:hypothetical protein
MACKQGEIQEAIEWDDYGTPTEFKCVANSNQNGSGSKSGFDKAMEILDKILQGAEIVTGNKSNKGTKKGDFGGGVNYNTDTTSQTPNTPPSVFDNKLVLIGGGVILLVFGIILFKAFSKKSGTAPVATPIK